MILTRIGGEKRRPLPLQTCRLNPTWFCNTLRLHLGRRTAFSQNYWFTSIVYIIFSQKYNAYASGRFLANSAATSVAALPNEAVHASSGSP